MSASSSPLTTGLNAWEMELFWGKHKRRIRIGAIVLGIVILGTLIFFMRDYRIRQASETLLARASTAEQLQKLILKYPSSNAAASALLLLAAEKRNAGNLGEADALYQKFLKRFPQHSLAPGAALGIVENILAAGRRDEGISALQTLAAKYPTSYVAPFALFTQADLLAFLPGQAPEAKKQLRDLNRQFPDSVSARYSINLLVLLGAQEGSPKEKKPIK